MKKIAVPVQGNNVSTHFGYAPHFKMFSVEDNSITKEEVLENPGHQPGFTANAAPQGVGRGLRNGADRGPGFGRGFGRGRRMGYGGSFLAARGRGAYYEPAAAEEDLDNQESKDREVTRLENIANTLASELEIVKKQIDELKIE